MSESEKALQDTVLREFHISRKARDLYQVDEALFTFNGNVIFADFQAARRLAQQMNAKRDLINDPEKAVQAGEINAMGLIDEILHYVVRRYREERNPDVLEQAVDYLEDRLGEESLEQILRTFVDEFPPVAIYRGELTPEEYLEGETDGTPHRLVVLEELLLLWAANENPGFEPYEELFDDTRLEKESDYSHFVAALPAFFDTQPRFGPDNDTLVEMLLAPGRASPDSLSGQLEFIRERWGSLLGDYLTRLLRGLDFLAEEERMFFDPGPGPALVYEFGGMGEEPERFSPDSDWMPSVILLAKNVYVWLDQLTRDYGHDIHRLDQIPDEELDKLAHWGFTGLWLIGLWERSEASKRIKQIMGKEDAVASAYSLYDYVIAADLGGEDAFNDLKARAWRRGIRMASDMVPNHMGIDSRWVIQHPDWFIGLDHSPFPTYSFNGPNLCDDDRVGVYIEDHYYDHSDAAVVFKRVDHWTGDEKFIYHGNDGTSMPWNDTAQLNFLKEEVREAVIQTILHVAHRSPIIRFDAAMTLAKRHYRRLWFPEPGSGGAIPSRAEHGMPKETFEELFPQEFWRLVVDRVAEEVPDTLLLAEAFWMMEGYFVRTLGMHRVYNSAFMNMLRDEKNDEYRQLMKNTLEFDPQILKRYVNFMNNPDERTAVDQFGKDDKYFGICTLMVTLPGLPMFGHGQVEGYAEKYGMEFHRAYWNETPDQALVERHERQIFPLLYKRYLFAEVDNFYLYDFYTPEGPVDENVFAYSNRRGDERTLVLYHNAYAETRGWVRTSVAFAVKNGDEKQLVQRSLDEGLRITSDPKAYLVFRDTITDLEYIRNCRVISEQGLYAELHAYQAHVFTDFRLVQDDARGRYAAIHNALDGRGVPSVDVAMRELFLKPIHEPLRALIGPQAFRWLLKARQTTTRADDARVSRQVKEKLLDLLEAIQEKVEDGARDSELEAIAERVHDRLLTALGLPTHLEKLAASPRADSPGRGLADYLAPGLAGEDPRTWETLFGWLMTHQLGRVADAENVAEQSLAWLEDWLLGKLLAEQLQALDVPEAEAWRCVSVIKLLLTHDGTLMEALASESPTHAFLKALFQDKRTQTFLGVNRYEDVLWFNKEAFNLLLWWLNVRAAIVLLAASPDDLKVQWEVRAALLGRVLEAEAASGYQVKKLLATAEALDEEQN